MDLDRMARSVASGFMREYGTVFGFHVDAKEKPNSKWLITVTMTTHSMGGVPYTITDEDGKPDYVVALRIADEIAEYLSGNFKLNDDLREVGYVVDRGELNVRRKDFPFVFEAQITLMPSTKATKRQFVDIFLNQVS